MTVKLLVAYGSKYGSTQEVAEAIVEKVKNAGREVVSGAHGLLVADPSDLASFGTAVETLLRDRTEAGRLGANAKARAGAEFLGDRHLEQYGQQVAQLG